MSSEVSSVNWFLERKAEGKKFVLSIDGGGTMGLLPLHCLKKLEDLAGQPCYELFDFYAGTSTGAIIAAALACRKNADELITLYKTFIQYVFPPQPDRTPAGWIVQAGIDIAQFFGLKAIGPQIEESLQFLIANDLKYLYKHQRLWELTKEHLHMLESKGARLTLGDTYADSKDKFGLPKRLLITFKDVERSETLFAVNAGPGAPAFAEVPLTYVVLASSTAPVYLEPFRVWVDGGVGSYFNPCYRAVIEATQYFTGEAYGKDPDRYKTKDDDESYRSDNIIVFSFGTGYIPNFRTYTPNDDGSANENDVSKMTFFDWMRYVISEQLDEANNEQVLLTQDHFSEVDFRRYQLTLDLDLLEKAVDEGGLGFSPGPGDRDRIAHLSMVSSSDADTAFMESLGQAWAEAIGHNFTKAHYPFERTAPYWPAGAVPLRIPAKLEDAVPSALREYRNEKLPRLSDYLEAKVSELERTERYRLAR